MAPHILSLLFLVQAALAAPGEPAEPISDDPPALTRILAEVRERALQLEHARRHITVLESRTRGTREWPNPTLSATWFALPVETRVGPQRLQARVEQRFPLGGKLELSERTARLMVEPAKERARAVLLDLIEETRLLFYELAFLERHALLLRSERRVLERYESAAQARYASGRGMQQEIVRIQAQITRLDTNLLEITERSATLVAELNALRDRAPVAAIEGLELPTPIEKEDMAPEEPTLQQRLATALERSPDLLALDAELTALGSALELEERARRPDMTMGLAYTMVEKRGDAPARLMPPEGNGDDILALTVSMPLYLRKERFAANEDEIRATMARVESERRLKETQIRSAVGDLHARLPLLREHYRLLLSVLRPQATEALRSAETAYGTGQLNAVDLLDAEVVLFEVNIQIARTQADLARVHAHLDRYLARDLGDNAPIIEAREPIGGSPGNPLHEGGPQ